MGVLQVGATFPTNKWGFVVVREYQDAKNVLIEFLDTGNTMTTRSELIRKGIAEDITVPVLFGKGFIGNGPYSSNKFRKEYNLWSGVLERVYCPKLHKKRPTYNNVILCPEWHNFQEFTEWCQWQKGFKENNFQLDKDLLSNRNLKEYGPETCCFLPRELNTCLVFGNERNGHLPGVYWDAQSYRVSTTNSSGEKVSKRFISEEEAFDWYCNMKDEKAKFLAEKYSDILDERALLVLKNFNSKERWNK